MVNSVVFKNLVTGKQIEMHRAQAPYVIESIDWDSPSITPNTYRVPFQIGETLNGIVVGTRKPTLMGYVIADTSSHEYKNKTWNEYYAMQLAEIEKNKKELASCFNVYQNMLISVDGYMLNVRPITPVKYSNDYMSNNDVLCMFSVELECYEEPLFYKKSTTVDLATIKGMFHFPMTMTEDATDEFVAFGEIQRGVAKELYNGGDIPIGIVATIEAKGGDVKNPSVYDANTGKGFYFSNYTLKSGNKLIVNTNVGHENVTLHDTSTGEDSIALGYLSVDSEYVQLQQGSTFCIASAVEGSANMYVSVTYTDKYFNFETM